MRTPLYALDAASYDALAGAYKGYYAMANTFKFMTKDAASSRLDNFSRYMRA